MEEVYSLSRIGNGIRLIWTKYSINIVQTVDPATGFVFKNEAEGLNWIAQYILPRLVLADQVVFVGNLKTLFHVSNMPEEMTCLLFDVAKAEKYLYLDEARQQSFIDGMKTSKGSIRATVDDCMRIHCINMLVNRERMPLYKEQAVVPYTVADRSIQTFNYDEFDELELQLQLFIDEVEAQYSTLLIATTSATTQEELDKIIWQPEKIRFITSVIEQWIGDHVLLFDKYLQACYQPRQYLHNWLWLIGEIFTTSARYGLHFNGEIYGLKFDGLLIGETKGTAEIEHLQHYLER